MPTLPIIGFQVVTEAARRLVLLAETNLLQPLGTRQTESDL